MDNREKLKNLLSVADREEYDDDAVRALLNRDPAAARGCDFEHFEPLHEALRCDASPTTVGLLCDACPHAVREKNGFGATALHLASRRDPTSEVVRLLHERWPEAIAAKDEDGWTPLHYACNLHNGPSLEVVKYLVDKRPEALAEKTPGGGTPLLLLCGNPTACNEVVKFLVEKHADAAKEKDNMGWFPLHAACGNGLSLEVVTLLANVFPQALESETEGSRDVPLHLACWFGATPEVVRLLVERCPKTLEVHNGSEETPLKRAKNKRDPSTEIIDLLSTLHSLKSLAENDPKIIAILRRFQDMDWPGGVALVLDAFPSVVNTIDHSLFPTILSMVGRRCSLSTFYAMLQDNPTLVNGAVKTKKDKQRSELPPAKRIRK